MVHAQFKKNKKYIYFFFNTGTIMRKFVGSVGGQSRCISIQRRSSYFWRASTGKLHSHRYCNKRFRRLICSFPRRTTAHVNGVSALAWKDIILQTAVAGKLCVLACNDGPTSSSHNPSLPFDILQASFPDANRFSIVWSSVLRAKWNVVPSVYAMRTEKKRSRARIHSA